MLLLYFAVIVAVVNSGHVFGGCPSGWSYYNKSCYYFSTGVVNWADALVICKIHGAYLAEIHSRSENYFIYQRARKHGLSRAWLGAIDDVVEGRFIWSHSKKPLSYTRWHSKEPNNMRNEHCLEILRGYWNDNQCSAKSNYVCEKRPRLNYPGLVMYLY